MKQKITIEQVNSLSYKGKDAYFAWMVKKGYLSQYNDVVWGDTLMGSQMMSIGQMIEYLVSIYGKRVDCDQYKDYSDPKSQWIVEAKSMTYIDEELCDALWQAVKEVLEK